MASSPGGSDKAGGWAVDGFTEIKPPDPSASQGDGDVMLPIDRNQTAPSQNAKREKYQFGNRKIESSE